MLFSMSGRPAGGFHYKMSVSGSGRPPLLPHGSIPPSFSQENRCNCTCQASERGIGLDIWKQAVERDRKGVANHT